MRRADQRRVGERQPCVPWRERRPRRRADLPPPARPCRGTATRCVRRGRGPSSARSQPGGLAARAQRLLVLAGGGVEIGRLGAPAEHVRRRDARGFEQRLTRHPVVGLRVIGRYGALVAEEDVGARPVDPADEVRVKRARCRSARERDPKPPAPRAAMARIPAAQQLLSGATMQGLASRGRSPDSPRPARPARPAWRRRRARPCARPFVGARSARHAAIAGCAPGHCARGLCGPRRGVRGKARFFHMGAFEELSWRGLVQQTTAENMGEVLARR